MENRPPSVFVSSTMYDLGDLRAGLQQFVEALGWKAVLAEHSSFSVDTSETTVENSLRNVRENSDIFVMVVGARYGSVDPDSDKSVTNLEFLEARVSGVPVYVFVDSGVLAQLRVWHDNPEADFSSVVDTTRVFEFIDSFYRSGGVWTFPFSTAGEIVDTLLTQFAYLVRDALEVRKITGQREEATEAASVELTEVRHRRASRQPQVSGLITATLAAGPNRYTFEGVDVSPHQDSRYRFLDVRKQGISPAEYASLCRALGAC